MARFHRPGLDEEYTVGVDGVRQDFVVTSRPPGSGKLQVDLELSGLRAEPNSEGAFLVLDDSQRKLAYHRLQATDASGRKLPALMAVLSPRRLTMMVDDAAAAYPVRIDPTFSDANWLSFGGVPGSDGFIGAMVVDASNNIYVGGSFSIIGATFATNIAKWDGTAWSPLGSGISAQVSCLACDNAGTLYAGGYFIRAGVESQPITSRDGTAAPGRHSVRA